jgi:hypothetical protein
MTSPDAGRSKVVAVRSRPSATTSKSDIASSSPPGATKSVKWRLPTSFAPIPIRSRAVVLATWIQPSRETSTRGRPGSSHQDPVIDERQRPSR